MALKLLRDARRQTDRAALANEARLGPGPRFSLEADLDLTGDGLQDLLISTASEVRDGEPGGVYVLESPVID